MALCSCNDRLLCKTALAKMESAAPFICLYMYSNFLDQFAKAPDVQTHTSEPQNSSSNYHSFQEHTLGFSTYQSWLVHGYSGTDNRVGLKYIGLFPVRTEKWFMVMLSNNRACFQKHFVFNKVTEEMLTRYVCL